MQETLEWEKDVLPLGIGAKDDGILISLSCKSACSVIKSIAVSLRPSSLEDAGIGRLACSRIRKLPTAAVLVQPKCIASTLACNYYSFLSAAPHHMKLLWTTWYVSFSDENFCFIFFFFFFVKMLLYGKKGSTSICISMAIEGNAIKQ